MKRFVFITLIFSVIILTGFLAGCSDDSSAILNPGPTGPNGSNGPNGSTGSTGPNGPAGPTIMGSLRVNIASETGETVSNYTITLEQSGISSPKIQSSADQSGQGFYLFTNVRAGFYDVTFEAPTYGTITKNNVEIKANEQTVVDFTNLVRPLKLYGVRAPENFSDFYLIDPNTGATTLIGNTGYHDVSAMDVNPKTGVIYATGWRTNAHGEFYLFTIDPNTGKGTEIGALGISSDDVYENNTDISFDSDGNLYGLFLDNDNGEGHLGTIDINTGTANIFPSTGYSGAGNGIGFSHQVIGSYPANTLFWTSDATLYTLNTTTGAATYAGDLSDSRFTGLAFNPDTGILFASYKGGGERQATNALATIDVGTGTVTIIGPTAVGLGDITWSR